MATTQNIQELKKLLKKVKLKTATNYSKNKNMNRRTVYNMANDKRLNSVKIDGVLFIVE
jgi:hypothetical protein